MTSHHEESSGHHQTICRKIGVLFLVFCWPFIYLLGHVFPIHGEYTAIGNDFISLYYKYKVYLLASLSDGYIPLWSPSEGCGFPFYSNPFAQLFYPLNGILLVWYNALGGYDPIDHQIFTVLGISIFSTGLFLWLKKMSGNIRTALFSVLIMSVSFKITEITRFPNAVHSAAWYPWILYAVTGIMMGPSRKEALLFGMLLVFSAVSLCTAGYPYYIYYSLFLFIPYFLTFLIKPLKLYFYGDARIKWPQALVTLMTSGFIALIICGPYLFSIKSLMDQTTDRAGNDFAYSTANVFSFEDTLGSLTFPPSARPEGWYFFSISALLILLVFGLCHIRNHSASTDDSRRSQHAVKAVLFFVIWFCTISYITYGKQSHLFIFLWNHLPGFSRLRVWGRFNIILVPVIAWWLSMAYGSFESYISNKHTEKNDKINIFSPLTTTIVIYFLILGIQVYLYHYKRFDAYWLYYFKAVNPYDITFILMGIIPFIFIVTIFLKIRFFEPASNRFLNLILVILLVTANLEMYPVGTRMWTYREKVQPQPVHLDMKSLYHDSFQYPRVYQQPETISVTPQYRINIIPNWYFDRYKNFLEYTENEKKFRDILLGVKDGKKIFISNEINHKTVHSFLNDALQYKDTGKLISYSGNELIWDVNMPGKGYLSFIDNWEKGWSAYVDGNDIPIELLFGTFKSVKLSSGMHRIKFCYTFNKSNQSN